MPELPPFPLPGPARAWAEGLLARFAAVEAAVGRLIQRVEGAGDQAPGVLRRLDEVERRIAALYEKAEGSGS